MKFWSNTCTQPSHLVVSLKIIFPQKMIEKESNEFINRIQNFNDNVYLQPLRYKFQHIPDPFMNYTDWERISIDTVTQLENMTSNQDDIDSDYVNLCYALCAEADKYLDSVPSSHRNHNHFGHLGPVSRRLPKIKVTLNSRISLTFSLL